MSETEDTGEISILRETYFSTMAFYIDCPDHEALNNHLLDLIYAERANDQEGIERSNMPKLGGWHSRANLHMNDAYRTLVGQIHQAGQRISSHLSYHPDMELKVDTMWSIINGPGSSNKAHIHGGSLWSGVYYVQTPNDSGALEFTDPRTAKLMTEPKLDPDKVRERESWSNVHFQPQAGKMVIFPSWLYHNVEPNLSRASGKASDRIIISFNMTQMNRSIG